MIEPIYLFIINVLITVLGLYIYDQNDNKSLSSIFLFGLALNLILVALETLLGLR